MGAPPIVHRFATADALFDAAAVRVADLLVAAVASRGRASVALSGGSTPPRLYARLVAAPLRGTIPWDRVHVFFADERCVPTDHPWSNAGLAVGQLLSRVAVPAAQIHFVPTERAPAEAAAAYARDLAAFFAPGQAILDLALLGVGADGHTASLFPGRPEIDATDRLTIAVPDRVGDPAVPRVTLTLPVLAAARAVLFLVPGTAKTAVVDEILGDPSAPDRYPAARIGAAAAHASARQEWFVERPVITFGALATSPLLDQPLYSR